MLTVTAKTEGRTHLGLREVLQRHANGQWFAEGMTADHSTYSMLNSFKRAVRQELELLELIWRKT